MVRKWHHFLLRWSALQEYSLWMLYNLCYDQWNHGDEALWMSQHFGFASNPTHRNVAGIDVIGAWLIIDERELDSWVVVGEDICVTVLSSVVRHEGRLLGMVQTNLCHSLCESWRRWTVTWLVLAMLTSTNCGYLVLCVCYLVSM